MKVIEAVKARRTVRKFKQDYVKKEYLIKMIDAARVSPCAGNVQSLKYKIIDSLQERKAIFPYIKYAGYIPEWNPEFSDTPPVFIAVLNDTSIRNTNSAAECDSGIAIMAISLTAVEMGLDSCILGGINRNKIAEILNLSSEYCIMYLIGIGKSNHKNLQFNSDVNIKYIMEKNGDFKVPKRKLESIIVK